MLVPSSTCMPASNYKEWEEGAPNSHREFQRLYSTEQFGFGFRALSLCLESSIALYSLFITSDQMH